MIYWIILDYTSDIIYLADMAFRSRTGKKQNKQQQKKTDQPKL